MKRRGTLSVMVIALALTVLLAAPAAAFAQGSGKMKVSIRIEGIEKNLYYKQVEIPYTGSLTLKDAMVYLTAQEPSLNIVGADNGYITSVKGEAAAKFGGWDGWLFKVNGQDLPVGIDEYELKQGDKVVLFYGDPFGVGMQFPEADTSKITEGIIKFTSSDTVFDEAFNPTVTVNPVKGAAVTWYYGNSSAVYTTDDNGEIKIKENQLTKGAHKLGIAKKNEAGLPLVLRLAPDFTVEIKGANTGGPQTGDAVSYQAYLFIIISAVLCAAIIMNRKHAKE